MAGRAGRRVYRNRRWARVRRRVLDRDGWRCVVCGGAGVLEVHHRQPLADGGAEYAADNLESRCRRCHFAAHAPAVAPDAAAWREFMNAAA